MPIKKIEIELEIPDGYEFDEFRQDDFTNHSFHGPHCEAAIIFKPIEPPLELETEDLLLDGKIDKNSLFQAQGDLHLRHRYTMNPAEARDLAKILNYWAEKGKLPSRVVVKGGENESQNT